MTIKIKAKNIIDNFFPMLYGALNGKININDNTIIEIFGGEFSFTFRKDKDFVTVVFTGKKPKIIATRGIWIFQADFQGNILEVSFNKSGGFLKLEGLPQQHFEFI